MKPRPQEVIHFENILLRNYTSPRNHYPLNSIGNISHWLYVYNCIQYDLVTIGNNEVHFNGKLMATYSINEERQMPVFSFTPEFAYLDKQQSAFIYGLDNKFEDPFASNYNTEKL
jgi:hypothetical protein